MLANSCCLDDKLSDKPLLQIKNIRHQELYFRGTPASTLAHPEHWQFNKILYLLKVTKLVKTLNRSPGIPFHFNS